MLQGSKSQRVDEDTPILEQLHVMVSANEVDGNQFAGTVGNAGGPPTAIVVQPAPETSVASASRSFALHHAADADMAEVINQGTSE
jgi:hypothetical protein